MIIGRKKKREIRSVEGFGCFRRREVVSHSESLQQVGASAGRGSCIVAVFDNRDAATSQYKSGEMEMLKLPFLSPPVPQVSIALKLSIGTGSYGLPADRASSCLPH